ncbi:MAG: tryptophanase, partial [Clostridiaceae bacterium]|nr:tryptophanase [Clostridiaceae bacterium]
MEDVSEICKEFKIPLIIDAARYAENAYFIKRDEAEYKESSMRDIVKKLFSFADYFTMSAKKDGIVNMGGVIGVKDPEDPLINNIRAGCISYEGFYTYGGLNGRDLEAVAIGLNESLDESYLNYRVGQMEYLAARLDEADIAYQAPVGGHGVFVDAAAMFPHIPYYEFPGQVLGVELYIEAGIRTSEIGSYMLGNDPDTNEQLQATFEFSRLAIPRRVYTQAHLDVVADALISIKQRANECKRGYRIIWEPPILRHFQAHLEPIIE